MSEHQISPEIVELYASRGRKPSSNSTVNMERRMATGRFVDEKLQRPIRERLRLMQEARRLGCGDCNTKTTPGVSPGSLTEYELHDISTLSISQMWVLAHFYGMEFNEFIAAVILGNEEVIPRVSGEVARITRLLDRLGPEDAEAIIEMAESILDTRLKQQARKLRAR